MDLDDAYTNGAYIPDGEAYPDKWARQAAAFRETVTCELDLPYGEGPRERFDLFHPAALAKGVVIFVHGGYWLRFDKSYWSHLAAGPLDHGWAVAMPSYDLCPSVRITDISQQIHTAIDVVSARVPGPVRLVGHSAGGHLVALAGVRAGVEKVVPISPISDLAPLMQTSMNADLHIDAAEADNQSPIRLPAPSVPVTVWVGGDERPAFLEQAQGLADAWRTNHVIEPDRHHFDVVEGLADAQSPLTMAVVS